MPERTDTYSIAFSIFAAWGEPEKSPNRKINRIYIEKPFDEDCAPVGLGISGIGLEYYYFGARYYDPQLGIYISQDKVGQFFNPYGYSTVPVLYIDEDGNFFWIPILIGAAIGAYSGYQIGEGKEQPVWD